MAAFHGNMGMCVRALGHILSHGGDGLRQASEDAVLAAFDRWVLHCDTAPPAPVRCRDPDDQIFIDLAVQLRATLFSKDACVLGLARALKPLGMTVARPKLDA